MTLLQIKKLDVNYGRTPALHTVSLNLQQGSVLAVLGRNGAGKSTLLNAITGSIKMSAGELFWEGILINNWPVHHRVHAGIALVPEGRRIFPKLSVLENLRLGGFRQDRTGFANALNRIYDLFPLLHDRQEAAAGSLSGGQQQMLAIGRALITDPKLLLLDEPSLGLAPIIVQELYEQLQLLREQGLTIILVEQQVERALHFADAAVVLNLGRVMLHEKPSVLLKDPRLVSMYMGIEL